MQSQSNSRGWVVRRGTSYEARWVGHDGKRHAKRGFTQKKQAESFARQQAGETRKVLSGEVVADRPATVDALLDTFLERHGRFIDVATLRKLAQQLKHARSEFGSRKPDSIRKAECEDWKLTLPAGSAHDVFRAFRQALAWGVEHGLCERNGTLGIRNPKRKRHERRDVTPFQSWDEVEAVAAELDERYRAIPIVAAGTGLRPEELFGLHRADVDKECGRIHVHRRATQGEVKPGTKTGGERFVPYGERVAAALESLPPRIDTPILFPAPRGGYIDVEKFRHREWVPALRAAGVAHRRLYDLRHSYASWQLAMGTPPAKLALMMGTSIAQLDDTYHRQLVSDDGYGAAVDNFGKAVGQ